MTNFIIENQGKVLTNSIQLENLYKVDEKKYFLKHLGRAGILDEIKIRNKYIRFLMNPLIKG
jgi:hypothetical protein